jgi:hypothetical protein
VIHFLHAEGQSVAEIHCRLCCVYDHNVLNDSCVRKWCRKFRDGRTDVHDEGGQERHSIVTDKLVHNSGTTREFCWQNAWHQGPQKRQRFIVKR